MPFASIMTLGSAGAIPSTFPDADVFPVLSGYSNNLDNSDNQKLERYRGRGYSAALSMVSDSIYRRVM